MKTRLGFVSNSSSASFTLIWRVKDENDKLTVSEAVAHLMEYGAFEEALQM